MAGPPDGPLQLPYYAPNLPFELPTQKDIASPDEVLCERGVRKIVRIGEKFVVKYGPLFQVEAESMMFIRQSTSVPIPAVYAVYRSTENGLLYIVMEYIRGGNLLSLWPGLSPIQKSTICQRLKEYLAEIRRLPSPGYFGGLGRTAMPEGIFWTGEGDDADPIVNGPFETEEALNNALAEKAKIIDSFNNHGTFRSDFYRRHLKKALQNHHSVFAHGDFQRKNIIIRPREMSAISASSGEVIPEANFDVILIDWEKAGWYPNYWEFCAASWSFRFDDDWPDHLESIIDPWPAEYPWLRFIATELWS